MAPARAASAEQARALDRASEELGLGGSALMALASLRCAELGRLLLEELPQGTRTAVLAGRGNNGGDALGCAQHLARWGCPVRVLLLANLAEAGSVTARQARAAGASGASLRALGANEAQDLAWVLEEAGLVVDGLLGTGSSGPLRGAVGRAVEAVNRSRPRAVLAVDVPSGLDASSGSGLEQCLRASDTLMLAIPKLGCQSEAAGRVAGRLWLGDIGVPRDAYSAVGLAAPDFSEGGLLRWGRGGADGTGVGGRRTP